MLSPLTFQFLSEVAANNNREWFIAHKHLYEQAREDVLQLVEKLIPEIARIDPVFSADTSAKKCVMRIYRDVRFSKNKDPYKKNFGIWFPAYGREGSGPGYYLHLQPENSFFGAGHWMPEAAQLKLYRQEIDYNGADFHAIIDAPEFKKHVAFGFSEMLKNAPKGYDPAHEDIQYLKLKSFEVSQSITDEEFFKPAIVNKLISSFEIVAPYIAFLRNALSA